MTNLDIIKYLAVNDSVRLAVLLDDIYCIAWNNGARAYIDDSAEIDCTSWLYEDASKCGLYYEHELKEWKEKIK